MRWRKNVVLLVAAVGIIATLVALGAGAASGPRLQPQVFYPLKADVSPAIRSMSAPAAPKVTKPFERPQGEIVRPAAAPVTDPVVQRSVGSGNTPAPLLSIEGVSNWDNTNYLGTTLTPADTEGAVGGNSPASNVYIQWVNLMWQIYDKTTGEPLMPTPLPGNIFWTGFGGGCEANNDGDIIVLYDKLADRWFFSQFSVSTSPQLLCMAVSASPDPLGAYYRYAINTGSVMPDYPKWSVWADAYYGTANQFGAASGAAFFAAERDKMLTGDPTAALIYFNLGAPYGNDLPVDFDGVAPAPGTPGIFTEVDKAAWIPGLTEDSLLIWYLTPDWTNPVDSCLGDACGGAPNEIVPVATFNAPLCGNSRNCIPQPPGGEGLDAISDRVLYRAAARDLSVPLGHQSLVLNHTVDAGGGIAGVRWYELQSTGSWNNWAVADQGTYAPDSDHRWMGSIGIDYVGDIALGYSVSSSSVYPSVRYAGRTPGDPSGTLQAEQEIVAGSGVQNTGYSRWGDYSAMQIDPVDQCTFWFTQMYDDGADNQPPYPGWMWNTRIGSFKYSNCSIGPTGTISGTVTNLDTLAPIPGALVTAGASSALTNGSGVYTMTLPVGTYDMTATKFGYTTATVTGVEVIQDTTTTQDFALQAVGQAIVDGYVVAGGHGWPLYARIVISATGAPAQTIYTDPATGYYNIPLTIGFVYTFDVTAMYPGYAPATRPVNVEGADQTQNFTLAPDAGCSAWGFAPSYFWYTNFEADNGGFTVSGVTSWAWGVITSGPGSAHSGSKAWATNPAGNYNNNENGYITSPVIDLSAHAGERVIVEWWQYLRSESGYDYGSAEASKDGGATWSVIYGPISGSVDLGWTKHQAILPNDFSTANFRVRFHFTTDSSVNSYPGYYVDDVGVFTQAAPPATVKFTEDFEADNGAFTVAGTVPSWAWGTPTSGPGAAHSGVNVWATNLAGNYNTSENSTLTSPVIDLDTETGKAITLSWWQYLQTESGFDPVYVEVTSNGSTWTTVYGPVSGNIDLTWAQHSVTLTDAYATPAFQFRFHFTSDSSINYPGWYVDDVQVSTTAPIPPPQVDCNPVGGTIVYGFVADANTALRLDGATVANDLGLSTRTTTDVNLGPGYYALFTPIAGLRPSTRTFTASMEGYVDDVKMVNLVPNTVQRLDFSLGAGMIDIDPSWLISRLYPAQDEHQVLTLTNNGVAAADFGLAAMSIKTTWPHASPVKPSNAPHGPKSIGRAAHAPAAPPRLGTLPTLAGVPAYAAMTYPDSLFVSWEDVTIPGAWTPVAAQSRSFFGGTFLAGDFSEMYVVDYDTNTLNTIDTATGAVTLIGPSVPGGGESWTGLAATPDGTMYGSATTCSSSTLYIVDPGSGALTTVGPVTNAGCLIDIAANSAGELYGVDIVGDNLIKIDPATGAGTIIGSLGVSANYAQGLSFDQTTDTLYWAAYTTGGELRVIDTVTGASTSLGAFPGGAEVDAFAVATFAGGGGLPWLVLDPTEGTVGPGTSFPVDAHFIADGADHFGLFRANIETRTNTPYDVEDVPVCFTKAFLDVPAGYWADGRVHSVAGARITTGCGSGNFCPDTVMTRGVMARWLLLARFGNLYSPPPCTGIFADVACESTPNADFIEALYNEGITAGCGTDPLRYCPDAPVTRGEMSVFILKASIDPEYRPPACTGIFNDVACPSMFGNWIEDLFNRQITAGCGGGNFCPDQATTRAEESVFVGKAWSIPMCVLIAPDKPAK